jgi:hypothetical protein
MGKAMGDATQVAPSHPWFRTRSPERAIHLCETAFYPHRLGLLGLSNGFGLTQRVTRVGPITMGDVSYETDVALGFDETRAGYHVSVPLKGWLESRHRGLQLTATPALASIYRPDGEMTVTRWPGGSRILAVKIDRVAVDSALETLVDRPVDLPIAFNASLPLRAGAAHSWVRLLLMVHRQLQCPDSMMRQPVVLDPGASGSVHSDSSWRGASMGFSCGDMGPLESDSATQGRTNPAKDERHHRDRTALPHTAASQQFCVHLAVTTQCKRPAMFRSTAHLPLILLRQIRTARTALVPSSSPTACGQRAAYPPGRPAQLPPRLTPHANGPLSQTIQLTKPVPPTHRNEKRI